MNKYGLLALNQWRARAPERLEQIEDPSSFFLAMGEQIEQQIQELTTALAGPDPQQEGYLEKVGRLNMARLSAEEKVLHEMVYEPLMAQEQDLQDLGDEDQAEVELVTQVHAAIDQARREDADQQQG